MEELTTEQFETGKKITSLQDTIRKEPLDRRSSENIRKRHDQLDTLWSTFTTRHNAISKLGILDHPYFKENFYAQVEETKNKTIQILKSYSKAITPAADASSSRTSDTHDNEKRLRLKREQLRLQAFDKVLAKINECEQITLTMAEFYLKTLTESWKDIELLHEEVLLHSTADDFHLPELSNMLEVYEDCKSQYNNIFIKLLDIKSDTPPPSESDIRLPRLSIPLFDGKYESWISFRDIFRRLIHNNKKLVNVEKMQYLKTHVRGEASRLINHLEISDANYTTAWEIMNDRYDNKRKLVNTQIEAILSLPKQERESPTDIRKLSDTIRECLYAIANFGVETQSWAPFIIHIALKKVDVETRRLFEQSLENPKEIPQLESLYTFLESRFQSLEAFNDQKRRVPFKNYSSANIKNYHSTTTIKCRYCQKSHTIYACTEFLSLDNNQRAAFISRQKLCKNCLNHDIKEKCRSTHRCNICKQFHHSLLHQNTSKPGHQHKQQTNEASELRSHFAEPNKTEVQDNVVILATALLKAKCRNEKFEVLRALIDPGSQATFITENAAQLLNLPRKKIHANVAGVGATKAGTSHNMIEIQIKSRFPSNFQTTVEALVLPKLTKSLPETKTEIEFSLQNLVLADPNFNRPGPIDMIIGADIYSSIILDGIQKPAKNIVTQCTELGWIILGQTVKKQNPTKVISMVSRVDVDKQLQRFWEIEDISEDKDLTSEERTCEDIFVKTYIREADGTYTVNIPLKPHRKPLGESKNRAMARYLQLERRFDKDPLLHNEYSKFIREYLSLGHMEPIQTTYQPDPSKTFYLPHQAVFKKDSTTTKLRVVFDASSKTSNGVSLNDTMYIGPKKQQDLSNILLRWRKYKIAFSADIEKMYRQIKIAEQHKDLQRILWRFSKAEEIKEYRLTTVTYGTAAAPYLAIRTLQQLAHDEKEQFPKAANILVKDFYVDDVMSGTHTLSEAHLIQNELIQLLKSGGFTLRKWTSNMKDLLKAIPRELREQNIMEISDKETIKTLGIHWSPHSDTFQFKVKLNTRKNLTKRVMLSEASKIFDPLGWLTPVTVKAKLALQNLWVANLSWDEELPLILANDWQKYTNELPSLERIRIPRWIQYKLECEVELHGFSDASEKAYSAVIYSKITDAAGKVTTELLTAKSKIAPVKSKLTIPRLELCGAELLAKLMKMVKSSLELKNSETYYWSDSNVVLAWIKGNVDRWDRFVANRVSRIQSETEIYHWNYVPSADNPADCASRGIAPSALKDHPLWWTGPDWLRKSKENWPENNSNLETTEGLRKRYIVMTTTQEKINPKFIERFSSLRKLVRTSAYCARFIHNCRNRSNRISTTYLTVLELKKAFNLIIKLIQSAEFKEEICCLKQDKFLKTNNKLLSLNPFLDDDGILRVGGRLEQSSLSFDEKHPIIIPQKHHLTGLIIDEAHLKTLHGGNQNTLAYIRRKFWIINPRDAVRSHIHKCIRCFRSKAVTAKQLMGDLPSQRITPSAPFTHTGIDYAGPIQMKVSKLRGCKSHKGYIAIFICFSTKAIHVEAVSDLTTEAFLAAFKRFTSRRGLCKHVYSDCGTNFVGAKRTLDRELQNAIENSSKQIAEILANDEIHWHFNPPAAPHFGGLWEAGVKSIKTHLKRVIGESLLTFEELTTVLSQIEASLNSRPLSPLSNDPADMEPLTPGHFLMGRAPVSPPSSNERIETSPLTRWKLVNKIAQDFWKAWSSEYLSRLQQRPKWRRKEENIRPGQLILLKEEGMPMTRWPLAKVTETHPGKDGDVRVVSVRTRNNSSFKRPITKICKLPLDHDVQDTQHQITPPAKEVNTNITTLYQRPIEHSITITNQINQMMADHKRKKKRGIKIHPASGYSTLIPLTVQHAATENYHKKYDVQATNKSAPPGKRATSEELNRPSKRQRITLEQYRYRQQPIFLTCLIILFLLKLGSCGFNITYPKPGLYIEHIGEAMLRRGTLRLVLDLSTNFTTDTGRVNKTIIQFGQICQKTRDFSHEIQCDTLFHHLKQKEYAFLEEINVLRSKTQHRKKRGVLGNILQSVFGVNDQVYTDISMLNHNQELLRQTIQHQSTVLLSTITAVNNTEAKTVQKLNMFATKLNRVITELNRAQGWFTSIDHNKANIHILASYQLATELINEYESHYIKLMNVVLRRGSLFDFVSPGQLANIIQNATTQIPRTLQIAHEPSDKLELIIEDTGLKIYGYLHILGTYIHTVTKATPIPHKIENNIYAAADIPSSIIAASYDAQTYFELSETELTQCPSLETHLYLCTPTVISSISENPNCIIDEIYERHEKKPCPSITFTVSSLSWKQLHMKNTWLFISNKPSPATIKCRGIRNEVVLNGTGIIQIDQDCVLETKKITLSPEVSNTFSVKQSFSKPIEFTMTNISRTKTQNPLIDIEQLLSTSDDFSALLQTEDKDKENSYLRHWKVIGSHAATGICSTFTTIIIIVVMYKCRRCITRKSISLWRSCTKTTAPTPSPRTEVGKHQQVQLQEKPKINFRLNLSTPDDDIMAGENVDPNMSSSTA